MWGQGGTGNCGVVKGIRVGGWGPKSVLPCQTRPKRKKKTRKWGGKMFWKGREKWGLKITTQTPFRGRISFLPCGCGGNGGRHCGVLQHPKKRKGKTSVAKRWGTSKAGEKKNWWERGNKKFGGPNKNKAGGGVGFGHRDSKQWGGRKKKKTAKNPPQGGGGETAKGGRGETGKDEQPGNIF